MVSMFLFVRFATRELLARKVCSADRESVTISLSSIGGEATEFQF